MSERVSIMSGNLPILIVAPHGFDGNDENTSIIAEHIAKSIGAYMVVNRGWERSEFVDFMLDKADCNNVKHCHEDVVKEEFLEPIIRFKNRILKNHSEAHIFYIHGMGNKHRKIAAEENMDIVIGYGAGSPNSYSCNLWHKDFMCESLNDAGIHTFQGRKGGPMSGWALSNMNQLFRKWYPEPNVHSMQIEIIHELRSCKDMAMLTADCIADIVKSILEVEDFIPKENFKSY